MTLSNIMRKVNRGIVLAILLVIGLIIYLIYDNARFASEKIAIQNMLNDYAKAAAEINILPEEEQKPGERPSQSALQKKLDESKAIINKYLTDLHSYPARESALRELDRIFAENAERRAYVTECTFTIGPIEKIKKNGPKHAIANIPINIELKTIGKPKFFNLTVSEDTAQQYADWGKPTSGEGPGQEIDTKKYTYTLSYVLYDAQLIKEKGGWKIGQIAGWYYGDTPGRLVED